MYSGKEGLSSVTRYSVATFTTDQQPIPTIASSVGNVKSKNLSSRRARARARPKKRVRNLQRHAGKDSQKGDRLTLARQHKREYFAQLARALKKPRFNPNLCYSLKPEYSSWKLIFWDNQQQEFTIQNTLLPTQRLVVPLCAITANPQY